MLSSFILPTQSVVLPFPPWFFVLAYTKQTLKLQRGWITERAEDKGKYQRNTERKTRGGKSKKEKKWEKRAVDKFSHSTAAEWERFNHLSAQSLAASQSPRLIFFSHSLLFSSPPSVTSGWGEKPFPERNKARNGGITESLSEWLNRPKPKAHTLSGERLNPVHDLYHQELYGHLGLIGFGPKVKKKKKESEFFGGLHLEWKHVTSIY